MLAEKVDAHEQELDIFKDQLTNFKPRQSVLEIGLMRTMDQSRLSRFQSILALQKDKYKEKQERREYAQEVKKQFEREQRVHDDKIIEMK